MAQKNGDGIVYHRSDCSGWGDVSSGNGYVRFYGCGGDADGSICGTWLLEDWKIAVIHHADWNFKAEDLNWLTQYYLDYQNSMMDPHLNAEKQLAARAKFNEALNQINGPDGDASKCPIV
jgi:hypothetical protein